MKSKYSASALNGGLRQANKSDLVAIGRALDLQCSERERSSDLARRVLEAAQLIKHNHDDMFEARKARIEGIKTLKDKIRGIDS